LKCQGIKKSSYKNDQLPQRGFKQTSEWVRQSVQDLDEKASNMDEKFSQEIEIPSVGGELPKVLKMKK
jgi:hypothetical protein